MHRAGLQRCWVGVGPSGEPGLVPGETGSLQFLWQWNPAPLSKGSEGRREGTQAPRKEFVGKAKGHCPASHFRGTEGALCSPTLLTTSLSLASSETQGGSWM